MEHYCLIGGSGFIGRHLTQKLVSLGKRVTVVEKRVVANRPRSKRVAYLIHDDGDERLFLKRALKGVDCVIHLAYSTVPKTSFEDPVKDIVTNLPSTVGFLQVCSDSSLTKVGIVSSGGTVYGRAVTVPISEDHPTNPISPYGITKLAVEKYALMFHEHRGLPVVVVRPGNVYGEGQLPFMGQGFVATAIESVLLGKKVSIFGKRGTVRDYIYVKDVADAIVAALEKGEPGQCYNIGSGTGRNNREVLDAIRPHAVASGLKPSIEVLPPRKFDVPVNILSPKRLMETTGWRVGYSFEEGIDRTWHACVREKDKRTR